MNVLICNSDPTAARVVRKVLAYGQRHGVVEASNGFEVIRALQQHPIDAMVLDAQMPFMNGLEILRIVRDSAQFASLPVVLLTTEADDATVRQLIALGVHDIVLLSVSPDALAARLEPAVERLSSVAAHTSARDERRAALRLGHDSVVLIVDGDSEYRQYFRKVVAGRFTISEAESGVQALEACYKPLPDAILLGTNLGLVSAERIAQRLRSAQGKSTQIIAIPPKSEAAAWRASGLYDDVIARTYIPAVLEKELARLLQPSSAFGMLSQAIPDVRSRIIRAAEQVFGVMLMTDVEPSEDPLPLDGPLACAVISIATPLFVTTLRILFDFASGREVAAAFLETAADEIGDDDVVSVVGEVANVLTGRLKAVFEERALDATIGLPVLTTEPEGSHQAPPDRTSRGVCLPFRAIDRPVMFQIDLTADGPDKGRATVVAGTGVLALRSDATT